jgi:hypothetical protein
MAKKNDMTVHKSDEVVRETGREAARAATVTVRGLAAASDWLVRHPKALLAVAAMLGLIVLYLVLATILFIAVVAVVAAAFIYLWMRLGMDKG